MYTCLIIFSGHSLFENKHVFAGGATPGLLHAYNIVLCLNSSVCIWYNWDFESLKSNNLHLNNFCYEMPYMK